MLDVAYAAQDSLGLVSWETLARRAGIGAQLQFASCMNETSMDALLDSNLELGRRIGIRGTPAVVVAGRLLGAPPSEAQLNSLLDSLRLSRTNNSP